MTVPRVSVLMAAYNARGSVMDAVESIRSQHYPDWELIVVDDGSSDGTQGLLAAAAAADPRIRLHANEANRGLAASLNHGLSLARGAYIARMDADDRALPERFALQVAFLDAHREVDILGGGALEMTEQGEPLGTLQPRETHDMLVERIYAENPFIHPTIMARRVVFERLGGYDASFRRGQDYELWLRAYREFRLHNLQQPLIWYARRSRPRWRDARFSSRVVYHALRREGRVLGGAWYVARPMVATAWAHLRSLVGRS